MELHDLRVSTVIGLVTILSIGCADDGNNVEHGDLQPDVQQQDAQSLDPDNQVIQSGRFLDSAVMGLAYTTPTQHGFTDIEGRFYYHDGESVAFYLGDPSLPAGDSWKLGETTAREVITPLELLGTDTIDQQVRNVLRLLQSLDVDRDASNGIEISTNHDDLPDGNLFLDLSLSDSEFEVDAVISSYIARAASVGDLVPVQTAVDHFQETLNGLLDKPVGTWIYTHGTIDGVAISDLHASILFESDTHYSAQFSWTGDNGSVSAVYSIDGMRIDSDVDDVYLSLPGEAIPEILDELNLDVTLQELPDSRQDFINVVLAVGTNLRVSPNAIALESRNGRVVLHYARGDTVDNGTITYLELDAPDDISSDIGDVVQLEAVAYSASSAIISPVQFSWSTSDPLVATVNGDGLVTAVGNGSVTIQASAAGFEVSVLIEVSIENIDTAGTDGNGASEESQAEEEGQAAEQNDPEECPDGYVKSQSNEQHVSQQNTGSDNPTLTEQSNQQSVSQVNSGDNCVPATIVEVIVQDTGL